MTLLLKLPWEKTAKVAITIEDEPLFPTPGERGELREPTVEEYRQILIKLARLDFQTLEPEPHPRNGFRHS
jgi:hypothetical protein